MKFIYKVFIWSWIITLPITICTTVLVYQALDRYYTFGVRYNPAPIEPPLSFYINYEIDLFLHKLKVTIFEAKQTKLPEINLFIPHSEIAKLEQHMPQSGFSYVKARMLLNNKLVKAKVKYRGDFLYHWAWDKKSIRVKLNKNKLYDGLRAFNLQAPKQPEQLNNYLGLRLAKLLGLIAPDSKLVQVNINNENKGIHVLIEQLKEATLRRNNRMPGDIYRGEIVGKDAFKDSGENSLFDSPYIWDKMAINNHYPDDSIKPLIKLISIIKNKDNLNSQKELSELMDMDAWATFSLFETLTQSNHYSADHNWRLYYDPWKQKIVPIIWDPMSWLITSRPHETHQAVHEIIGSELHKALFNNEEFLRARNQAFQDFFKSGNDKQFLKITDTTIKQISHEISMDPAIMPINPVVINNEMHRLKESIHHIFSDIQRYAFSTVNNNYYYSENNLLNIALLDHVPIKRLRIDLKSPPDQIKHVAVQNKKNNNHSTADVSGAVSVNHNTVIIDTTFLPDSMITNATSGLFPHQLTSLPTSYILSSDQIKPANILAIHIDKGNDWEVIEQRKKAYHPPQNSTESIATVGWQLFWDTGNGFNAKQSTPLFEVTNIKKNLWTITNTIPNNVKKLRVDLPALVDMSLSNIELQINDIKYQLPLTSMTPHMMRKKHTTLHSDGHDPFFVMDVEKLIKAAGRDNKEIVIKIQFNVKVLENNLSIHRIVQDEPETNRTLYATVSQNAATDPIIWSGKIEIKKTTIINQQLLIKPGTTLIMHDQASLIIKHQLLALGTVENPIKIVSSTESSKPWGAIVLQGNKADNSRLSHCQLSGGSGLKGDLFEYTAMLSIHDVKNVSISNCVFKDSKITDDMVHAVYSELTIDHSSFINAFADALDIDISKAEIVDSVFINSGNDAIDLMTAQVSVTGSTLHNSGDKGISVGENSQLLAINNYISENSIGVQAKDNSTAVFFNQSFVNNNQALNAYKKNWRYGSGGRISVAKSIIRDNELDVTAGKQSKISIFDSYWDSPRSNKKIAKHLVDSNGSIAINSSLLSNNLMENKTKEILNSAPSHIYSQIKTNIRGTYTDALTR